MKNIDIDFQCSLNSKLLQKIIGKHLNSIHVQEGSYAHLKHESFMGLGNFYITFKNSTTNNYHSIIKKTKDKLIYDARLSNNELQIFQELIGKRLLSIRVEKADISLQIKS